MKGAVLYSQQDDERMREHGLLLLAYGPIDLSDNTVVGMPTEEVGKVVVATFQECGCEVEWDGSPLSRVRVTLTKQAR